MPDITDTLARHPDCFWCVGVLTALRSLGGGLPISSVHLFEKMIDHLARVHPDLGPLP